MEYKCIHDDYLCDLDAMLLFDSQEGTIYMSKDNKHLEFHDWIKPWNVHANQTGIK